MNVNAIFTQPHEVMDTRIILVLMREIKHRKVTKLAQGPQLASGRASKSGNVAPRSTLQMCFLCLKLEVGTIWACFWAVQMNRCSSYAAFRICLLKQRSVLQRSNWIHPVLTLDVINRRWRKGAGLSFGSPSLILTLDGFYQKKEQNSQLKRAAGSDKVRSLRINIPPKCNLSGLEFHHPYVGEVGNTLPHQAFPC